MRENELLSKEIIEDIYKRNYGYGGADDVEFGKIVAEYQHKKTLALFREEYQPFLEKVKAQPYTNQELMRQHGYVIDNLEDRWQKLVFTLHTNDAALSTEAEQLIEELQEGQ